MVVELDQATYRHLLVLILQFLYEENYNSTPHSLERESRVFFNAKYFLQTVESGAFGESEKYLSAFTSSGDNAYSQKLFNELHRQRDCRAREPGFPTSNASVRGKKFQNDQLISLIGQNPALQDKLDLLYLNKSGLLSIINLVCSSTQKDQSMLKEELLFLILQFLDEENFHETSLELEQEAAIFFNLSQLKKLLLHSEWDKANKYLSSFTSHDDNWHSFLMFYGITKQKFFEAICSNDDTATKYVSITRFWLMKDFKSLAWENQSLRDKLKFPPMDRSRLLALVKLVMDWFTPHCRNAELNNERSPSLEGIPEVRSLYRAQPNSNNLLCNTTSRPIDNEFIHQNSLLIRWWNIVKFDDVMLRCLVAKNDKTAASANQSLLFAAFLRSLEMNFVREGFVGSRVGAYRTSRTLQAGAASDDDIGSNVENSHAVTEQGVTQLAKACKLQRSNSSMSCLLLVIFGIILINVIIVVVA